MNNVRLGGFACLEFHFMVDARIVSADGQQLAQKCSLNCKAERLQAIPSSMQLRDRSAIWQLNYRLRVHVKL